MSAAPPPAGGQGPPQYVGPATPATSLQQATTLNINAKSYDPNTDRTARAAAKTTTGSSATRSPAMTVANKYPPPPPPPPPPPMMYMPKMPPPPPMHAMSYSYYGQPQPSSMPAMGGMTPGYPAPPQLQPPPAVPAPPPPFFIAGMPPLPPQPAPNMYSAMSMAPPAHTLMMPYAMPPQPPATMPMPPPPPPPMPPPPIQPMQPQPQPQPHLQPPQMPVMPPYFSTPLPVSPAPTQVPRGPASISPPVAPGSAAPPATATASASATPPVAPGNTRISVGNATLAALQSNEPPKFSCVLLSGIPAVGKTTMGRELVRSLQKDGLGWEFFSGGDFVSEVPTKRSAWDTTKEIFDALSKRLDDLLEQQRTQRNIKGLVIDKNSKGIEDIYYLNALLRAKHIPFVGIVGMEADTDDVLLRRMGGGEELREKLKFHRVIHARVTSLAKTAGMYRFVDATKPPPDVVLALRTMVLGCCAQPPTRGIRRYHYNDSRSNAMVDSYQEYHEVMTRLFDNVNSRGITFPGTTDVTPLTAADLKDKSRATAIRARYGVRQKIDGQHFLLQYHNGRLYMIPPHMRAVLQMPLKAWLGNRLDSVGTFILEGDLVRLTRDRQREVFLVYDVLCWTAADNPGHNIILRMSWAERQACLNSHLCAQDKAFFPHETDCIIVHQATIKSAAVLRLLDSEEYPSIGLVFQPLHPHQRKDRVLLWRQPSCVTVDFRLGPKVAGHDGGAGDAAGHAPGVPDPCHDHAAPRYALEVYDKAEKKYVRFERAAVAVRHPDAVEGCIVVCSLRDEQRRAWVFNRIRHDVLRPAYKHDVEELLSACLIPRAQLVMWLITQHIAAVEPEVPAVPRQSPAKEAGHTAVQARAAPPPPPSAPPASVPPPPPPSAAPAAGTKASKANTAPTQLQLLASIVPSLQVVRSDGAKRAAKPEPAAAATAATTTMTKAAAPKAEEKPTACAQCHRVVRSEELRMDRKDKKLYCLRCWKKMGWSVCSHCGEFRQVKKKPRTGDTPALYCRACVKYWRAEYGDTAEVKQGATKPNENSAPAEAEGAEQQQEGATVATTPAAAETTTAPTENTEAPAAEATESAAAEDVAAPAEEEVQPSVEEATTAAAAAADAEDEPAKDEASPPPAEDVKKKSSSEAKSGGTCRAQ